MRFRLKQPLTAFRVFGGYRIGSKSNHAVGDKVTGVFATLSVESIRHLLNHNDSQVEYLNGVYGDDQNIAVISVLKFEIPAPTSTYHDLQDDLQIVVLGGQVI